MRKVFLDDLPRWEKGEGVGNPGKINWIKSIGCKIKFIYDDIEGEIEIIDYNKNQRLLNVKYNNNNGCISIGGLSKCKVGNLLVSRYEPYKTDNFEIYNILKINKKGIVWSKIKCGEVLKTNHKKYGYNEFEFIEYNKEIRKICLKYKNDVSYISIGSFISGKIGKLINKHTASFKVELGQVFKDDKRDLIITDREYRKEKHGKSMVNGKWYKYSCNICGWTEGWADEPHLLNKRGCSCCAGKTVVSGINDITTTAPWMIRLGVSEEDALKHTCVSGKNIEVKCPDCGSCKNIKISDIYRNKSIGCRVCGDSVSYPEKFVNSVFSQKGVSFDTQKVLFKNNGSKIRYDFYFEYNNKKYIVETHGIQHYEGGFQSYGGRTLEEEQFNDRYKKDIALKYGIDEYIIIDCRYSELEWIKKSVLNSQLSNLFNLSNIDWEKCESFALGNLIKEVCDYWNNKEEWETVGTMIKNNPWGIKGDSTIRNYLKKGTDLNWCKYDAEEEKRKTSKSNGKRLEKRFSIPIYVLKDGVLIHKFNSIAEAERQSMEMFEVKFNTTCIINVAKGKQKQHRGFTFKYAEDID